MMINNFYFFYELVTNLPIRNVSSIAFIFLPLLVFQKVCWKKFGSKNTEHANSYVEKKFFENAI